MNTKHREMLAMINEQQGEPPVVCEIARWFVCGYSANWTVEVESMDRAVLQPGFLDDLRDVWPEATDEHIRRGLDLAVAAAAKAAER
jgi:hypothetical protein